MAFLRSTGRRPAPTVDARVDALTASGQPLSALALLDAEERRHPDPAWERRLVELRHEAFDELRAATPPGAWPPASTPTTFTTPIPTIDRSDLSAAAVRAGIDAGGCLLVPGALGPDRAADLVAGIDAVMEAYERAEDGVDTEPSPWYEPLRAGKIRHGKSGRRKTGAVLLGNSPRMTAAWLRASEDAGLTAVARDYLGERPAIAYEKSVLRRVPPDTSPDVDFHQDGAFFPRGVHVLNLWLCLSPCGADAPTLELLPTRLDGILETATAGAHFAWSAGRPVVEAAAAAAGVELLRPEFGIGDALFFDEILMHRTAASPTMTQPRYTIETWFFAPSTYPEKYTPLAV